MGGGFNRRLLPLSFKLRETIAKEEETTEVLKNQMRELDGNIQNVDAKIRQTEATLKELRKLQEKIATKTAARSALFKEQEKQYAALAEENDDTDEELKEWKTKFEERIAILHDKIRKLTREMEDIETKRSNSKLQVNEYIQEIGKLQNEADAHLSRKNERDLMIQKLYGRHNLGSLSSTPFSNELALNYTNRIRSRLIDLEKDLHEKEESVKKQVQVALDQYLLANSRWKDCDAQKQAKLEMKSGILKRLEEKKMKRDSLELEISNVNLGHIDQREKNLHIDVERKSKQLADREFESNIRQKMSEIYTIRQKLKDLSHEKDKMASVSEDRVKLSFKKADLENYKKKHKKIMDEYKDKIRGVLKGRFPPDKDLKKEVNQALRALATEFDELNSKSREANSEVNMLQIKIQEVNNNISKVHKDMDYRKRFIESKLQTLDQQSAGVDLYLKVLDMAKEKRDVHKSKYNIADGMRQMFDPFERVARAHHICPCCERPFSAEEEDEFVKKQRIKAASSAEHMKLLAVESSNADSHFQQLEKLRLVYEEYIKLGETIPLAEKNLSELSVELDQKSQALDDVLGVLAQIKAGKDSVESLVQPVETFDRLIPEIQRMQQEVDDLEYNLDFRGQGVKSMEEMQSELSVLQGTKDTLDSDLEKLRDEQRNMENDLSSITIRWHTVREEKVEAASKLRELKETEDNLEQLVQEKNQVDLDEKHLAEALGPLSKEVDKYWKDHENLKAKLNREYKEQDEFKRDFEHDVETLDKVISKIKEYDELRKGERLKDLREKQSLEEFNLQSYDTRKQELFAEVNKSADLVRNQELLRRNIEDNLNYRRIKAEVDLFTREIESLEEEILKIGGVFTFEADLEKNSKERERLLSEFNNCQGEVGVHQRAISKNKVDLKQAEYKDIDKRHFDMLMQLKTTEMANKDLDRYYNALDKALMRFHTMKMEEINKIIRELWQQTYRGQDIDYISIHSDSVGGGTRSYSYRVVMQTGDAELEMRGRCSAGQKVLASLIIRLALAETFCLNCGILALDEPTTNLDAPNAESLAAALLRIMEDRKGQENFQLIVITHDERFAQLIGQRQHAERYYRVTKDDHQHSIIETQEIFD